MSALVRGALSSARAALLAPAAAAPFSAPLLGSARWFKVRTSIKKMCDACYIVRRGKIAYVLCKAEGRHKQRQGPKNRKGFDKVRNRP